MTKYLSFFVTLFFILAVTAQEKDSIQEESTQLNEVVVKSKKEAIVKKADRTIFDFSEQAYLNAGSTLEGLKKLPGLIISDVAGMMYQGKQLEVYLDSRPLNIYSDELNAFLEGMPANSIEKVEIVTQPGAEFPATSGGAIINIITSKRAKNYLSASYSSGFGFTSYDKNRVRFNNSLNLNAKNKLFGWQINVGQNYNESARWVTINNNSTVLSDNSVDRIGRGTFIKSAIKFDFKKDRLLLNYDINFNNNDASTLANGVGFNANDNSKTKSNRQNALITYQKRFNDVKKKLDFQLGYIRNNNDFNLNSIITNSPVLDNSSVQDNYNLKVDYTQEIELLDKGKISVGALYDKLNFETKNAGIVNLNYDRETTAGYAELQTSYKSFDFIIGTRAENYSIGGNTEVDNLTPFNQFKVFPNASVQYNFAPQVFLNLNYNKKIRLPNTSALNPNNTNYQNPNVSYAGNPQLQPTIFNNFEVELSAFNYAFIGYSISSAKNQVVNRVFESNNTINNTSVNIPELKIHNVNIGLPIPYMLFTKGLKKTLEFDFNPDTINFLYFYAGYQFHEIPQLNTNGFWLFNIMSQILLPANIKFVANYSYSTPKGNYYYYTAEKPFNNSLDLTFSKKFLSDNLSVSLYFNDILNTNKQAFGVEETNVLINNQYDSRRIGFSINYKIPTKNKLAKEDPSLINTNNTEEKELIGN